MKQDENMTWSSEALHESQRPGTRIGRVLRPSTWAEAIELYDSLPEALPTAPLSQEIRDPQAECVRSRMPEPRPRMSAAEKRRREMDEEEDDEYEEEDED